MGTIKVNGKDIEMTDLSHHQASEQTMDKDVSNPELKVDPNLLQILESPKARVINNLA
jgi:hypothetical protein